CSWGPSRKKPISREDEDAAGTGVLRLGGAEVAGSDPGTALLVRFALLGQPAGGDATPGDRPHPAPASASHSPTGRAGYLPPGGVFRDSDDAIAAVAVS